MMNDPRNYLIYDVMEVIDKKDFKYIMIENVPRFLDVFFPYKGEYKKLEEILRDKYLHKYNIEIKVLNAKDYGVPQTRLKAIIKLYKKNLKWGWQEEQLEITLK